jgi:RNA polymerase sigma-70 factor (ECF subfamily)
LLHREPASAQLEPLLVRERSDRLWKAIDLLPEKFRTVVVLTYIEERNVADVSVLLKTSQVTVKSRLLRARRRLRALL